MEAATTPRPSDGSSPKPAAAARFVPEIQGLRAIAVGLVLLYHVSDSRLPRAGFIGVDVFFVISGFLITDHLVREVQRTGRIGLPRFYERRIRRLLPAASLVLVTVLALTLLVVPQTLWAEFGRQLIASALYYENWSLAINATNYAAAAPDTSPVQHFWSLAVEEQFYVFWPLMLLLGAWIGTHVTALRKVAGPALMALVVVVSFAWSIWQTDKDAGFGYFASQTRIWELGVGGLLAYAVRRTWTLPSNTRAAFAWLGLAMLGAAAFVIEGTSEFPGWIALFPVLGAALAIAAGENSEAGIRSPSFLLTWRPVQWVGDISYSLYLWHWPILILLPFVLDQTLGAKEKLAVIPLSILAAAASKYLVEDRFRANRPRPDGHTPGASRAAGLSIIGAASFAIVFVSVLMVSSAHKHEDRARQQLAAVLADPPKCFGAAALAAGGTTCASDAPGGPFPDPIIAGRESRLKGPGNCLIAGPASAAKACVFPSSGAPGTKRVALVGDSHAQQWLPALLPIAEQRGWQITAYLKSGCPLGTVTPVSMERYGSACSTWNGNVQKALLAGGYDAVIVSGFTGLSYRGSGGESSNEAGARGREGAWKPLLDAGVPVAMIRDNPLPSEGGVSDTPSCVEKAGGGDYASCGTAKASSLRPDPQVLAAKQLKGVTTVDLTGSFCPTDRCPGVIGDVIVYEVAGHTTATYARTLTPAIAERLRSFAK